MHTFKIVPEVTPMSSFHDLTKFLVFSFQEKNRREVEEILVKREKRLLDEFEQIKLHFHKLKVERDNLEKELELSKENSNKEMMKVQHILEYKLSIFEMEKSEFQEKGRSFQEKNWDLEYKMEVLEDKIGDLEYKIEILEVHKGHLQNKLDELEVQNEDLENKVNELEVQNKELENKNIVFEVKYEGLEYKYEMLERQNEDLQNEVGELRVQNGDLEDKIEVLEVAKKNLVKKDEVRNERLKKQWMVVEERQANMKGGFSSVCRGNDSGGGALTRSDSRGNASNLEICHTKSHASPGDPESNKTQPQVGNIGSEGISIGVRLEDSNGKSCHTKSQASFGNPSSKPPPQVESRGAEQIIVGAQLGEGRGCNENNIKFKRKRSIYVSDDDKDSPPFNKKTKSPLESGCKKYSLSEYEPEGGGCYDDNIMFKRKRIIYVSDDDKDSPPFNRKTKSLLESGRKKYSLSNDVLRKVNSEAPGVSKANIPPKFGSTSTKKYEDKNGSHENSEPHFKRSISGSVDGINRSARGDPHVASLKNKVVARFQSGKEMRWKYLGDMLSAFEEDDELCMASVCALYRRDISGRVSKDGSGFSSFDLVRGIDVAKYLIDGDPAKKLRRSVEEVRQNRPAIIGSCKRLVIRNGVQLFKIYQNKLDPFWPNSSILE